MRISRNVLLIVVSTVVGITLSFASLSFTQTKAVTIETPLPSECQLTECFNLSPTSEVEVTVKSNGFPFSHDGGSKYAVPIFVTNALVWGAPFYVLLYAAFNKKKSFSPNYLEKNA